MRLANSFRIAPVPSAEALSTTTMVARMPFWAITAVKQRLMYRLLLKVTMEMHTVGSGMRLGVVQSKDPSAANPTTLNPATPKIFLKWCSGKHSPRVFGDEGMSSFASDEQFVGLIRQEQTGTSLQDRVSRLDRKSTRLNSSHLGISYAVF